MKRTVTDEDILTFLRKNRADYPSEITLMQAAVRLLLPKEQREAGAERIVRLCLQDGRTHTVLQANHQLMSPTPDVPANITEVSTASL